MRNNSYNLKNENQLSDLELLKILGGAKPGVVESHRAIKALNGRKFGSQNIREMIKIDSDNHDIEPY